MVVRLDSNLFLKLLTYACGYRSKRNVVVDEVIIEFAEEGVKFTRLSSDRVLLMTGVFGKELFTEYEAYGRVVLPVEVITIIKDEMKNERELTFELSGNKYSISGENTSFTGELIASEASTEELSLEEYEGFKIPAKVEPVAQGVIIYSYARQAKLDGVDNVTFKLSGNRIHMIYSRTGGEMKKYIGSYEPIKEFNEFEASYNAQYIENILKIFQADLEILFTQSEDGTPAPITMRYAREHINVQYILAPVLM